MKQIIAFIKKHRLSEVTLALHGIEGLTGVSVTDVRGFGRGRADDHSDSEAVAVRDYSARVRLDVFCSDELMHEIIDAIEANAHTGLRGDGKIYVTAVLEARRISTGERGDAAV